MSELEEARRDREWRDRNPGAPYFSGCEHGVSVQRVERWWLREAERADNRRVGTCACCGGPCAEGYQACKFCRTFVGRQEALT